MHAPSQTTPQALAQDLLALVSFAMRTANADFFRRVAELDLSLSQLKALHLLDRAPAALSLKDLAAAMSLSVPAASRAVDGLVRAALVERREDDADRRVRRLALTASGAAVVDDLGQSRRAALEAFAETLDPDERTLVAGALAPLLALPQVAACRPKESV